MIRLIFAIMATLAVMAPSMAQQAARNGQVAAGQAQAQVARNVPTANAATADARPFPPLDAAAQSQLQQLLLAWQQQSNGTKTLECDFQRWHYDLFAAPAGVHASKSEGVIRYASPDKGLFRVDRIVFFKGMEQGKPNFSENPGKFGEHWVCNGKELIEFDREANPKQCKIQELPPEMQGQQIFNSPLPFVFNLDAQQIHQRYWVRQVAAPKPGVVLIEAWPKRQDDRAQYKLVQIALEEDTFLPQALIMYAPNFDAKKQPKWDHYEFTNMKRNSTGDRLQQFVARNFIPDRPGRDWKIIRQKFQAPVDPPIQQAQAPGGQPAQR